MARIGGRGGPAAFIVILLLAAALAQASTGRNDTFAVQDATRLQYHAVLSYPTPDAKKERALWDADNSSSIDAAEAAAYEANASASRLGAPTSNLRWDGNATHWVELGATTQGFVSSTYNGPFSLILDGIVNLTSLPGTSHTLTITNLSTYSSYGFALSLPSNWSISNVTGVSITSMTATSVAGAVNVNGIAVIQIAEPPPPPPPPPPINDTAPPTVDAGPNRTVQAGTLVALIGTATDNDAAFPAGATFAWAFVYNGTPQFFSGQNLSYTFWALGAYTLTFSAVDRSGNQANASVHVVVESPDTVPPVASAGPDTEVVAGVPTAIHGIASDNDPSFNSTGLTWWTFTYNGTGQNISGRGLAFVFWTLGAFEVAFFARDGWGNLASDRLVLTVGSPDTVAPLVSVQTEPVVPAGAPVILRGTASDNDPSFPSHGQFGWNFTYNGSEVSLPGLNATFTFWTLGAYTATFTAVDPWGNRNTTTGSFTVVSPDQTPPTIDAGPDDHLVAGALANLAGTASDDDLNFATNGVLWWTFDYGGIPANLSGANASFRFEVPGNYTATFWARDGWGNIASDTKTLVVDKAPTTGNQPAGSRGPDGPVLASLFVVGIGLAALGAAVAYRRRRAPAAPLSPAAAPALRPVPKTPAGPSYVLEGLLVLYKDGRLIYHAEPGAEAKLESPEVIGSMFAAVTEFIRDSFREAGALSRMSYGEHTIVLERSAHLVGAAISYGAPDSAMREKLKETLKRLELAYAGVVEGWNGDRAAFRGIEALVAPLLATTAALTRAEVREATTDKTVKVLSGTEHFRGYVRLKVALANFTNETLSEATLTVGFNEKLLVLSRVEPATLPHDGAAVRLGAIAPGERVGAIYYLDPQVCGESDITGKATYRDASGALRTVAMKTRQAEIICPIFFTPDHANVATLKRLVETSIAARDSKVYRVTALPAVVPFKDLFELAARAVSVRDVKLVRTATAGPPFSGRAWFYGRTKHGDEPVVVRVAAFEQKRAIEFFVAANSGAVLTGLLAELNRTFHELLAEELRSVRLEPVLDETLKALLTSEEFFPLESGADEG